MAENLKQQAAKIEKAKAEAEKRAAQLDGIEVVIPAKVSATGVTYGSVNAASVADFLQKKGIDIDRKIITMHDIRKVGEGEATIHFFKGVEVKLVVTVVAENKPAEKPAEAEAPAEKAEEAATEEAPKEEAKAEEEAPAEA